MAEELGVDPGLAAQVKGVELPMHDARAFHGQALSYATSPRGACHNKGDYYLQEMPADGIPEYGIAMGDRFQSDGKGVLAAKLQSFKDLYDAFTLCKFSPLSATQICVILSNITGWIYSAEDLLRAGERSINIKRALNNLLGCARRDDALPSIVLRALEEGGSKGKVPDMEVLLKEYYAYRQWDWETGKPARERLVELGMADVAADLWK
jgi:aldehyde:ferredoxin oxidoreductase